MLSEKIAKELNKQINKEMYSAYLYLAMSAHFEQENLPGMASWMDVQAKEEMTHAFKIYHYILERGGKVKFKSIEEPKFDAEKPLDIFKAALDHEKYITSSIYDLMTLSREEKDYATELMLNWFVTEQAEEEDNVSTVIDMLDRARDSAGGLFMIDRELGQRQFVDETQQA
jgi:ferritin